MREFKIGLAMILCVALVGLGIRALGWDRNTGIVLMVLGGFCLFYASAIWFTERTGICPYCDRRTEACTTRHFSECRHCGKMIRVENDALVPANFDRHSDRCDLCGDKVRSPSGLLEVNPDASAIGSVGYRCPQCGFLGHLNCLQERSLRKCGTALTRCPNCLTNLDR